MNENCEKKNALSKKDYSSFYEVLKLAKLVDGLSVKDLKLLCIETNPFFQQIETGTVIWAQGEYVSYVDIVVSGIVINKCSLEQNVKPVSLFKQYEIINLETFASTNKKSSVFMVAGKGCSLLRIDCEKLKNSNNIPDRISIALFANIIACLAESNIKYMNKSAVLSKRRVRDRILTFLKSYIRAGEKDFVDVKMSQEEFAEYLCVDRSSFSEALNELKREGLVENRNTEYKLKILNINTL